MFGWRGKIGLIIPSNNTVIEPEFWSMRPEGVTVHSSRILSHGNTPDGIAQMERSAARAVQELHAGQIDVIAYACLATSLVKGRAWTEGVAAQVAAETGRRATTAATAMVHALHAVGASRIALASAYPDRIQVLLGPFFEAFGFDVRAVNSLRVENSLELWRIPPDTILDLGKSVRTDDADAVCIVATDLPTVTVIDALERELGKPVVTTNQALMWHCLQLLGLPDALPGLGRLLAGPVAAPDKASMAGLVPSASV
jgi:arylmalonate decarboxylase